MVRSVGLSEPLELSRNGLLFFEPMEKKNGRR
jgi:hypothetical protein